MGAKASPAGAWWTVLLEKAAAKLYANYEGLNGGDPAGALRTLTGMPTSGWNMNEFKDKGGDDRLWEIIMKCEKNNWPMATSTHPWGDTFPTYLMPSHAYTVLGGKQLINADGSEGPKLVKIRNPHGNSRYNNRGPWRRDSENWTDSYLEQTGFTKLRGSQQGEFWFPLDRMAKDWVYLVTAHYNENFFKT